MSFPFNQTAMCVVLLAVFPPSCWSFNVAADFYTEAMDAFDNDDFTTAVRLFTRAIEQDHTHVNAFVARGTAFERLGELDKAINDYNEALKLDPKNSLAYVDRGNCWHEKGEIDKALIDYDEAIRLDPEYSDAYVSRGCVWNDAVMAESFFWSTHDFGAKTFILSWRRAGLFCARIPAMQVE